MNYASIKFSLLLCASIIILGAGCVTKSPGANQVSDAPPDSFNAVTLTENIEQYLNSKILKPNNPNGKVFSSFIQYGQEEKQGKTYYYLWVYGAEYYAQGKTLVKGGGISLPVVVIAEKDQAGNSKMVSHIVPRDGSLYNKDIATLFPKSIVNDVVKANTARTNLLNKEVRAKAENYFTMNSNITATADLQKLKCLEHSFDAYKTLEVSSQNGVDIINTTKTIPAASLAAIRKNYTGVVNFAGHYSVVSWKCGVNCWEHAVVEGNQGKIVSYGIKSKFGVDAKIDSNLLVVNPYAKILSPPGQGITTEYFKLVESEQDGTASLVLVCSYNDKGITGAGATPITPQQIPTPDTVSSTTPVGEIPKRYVSRNKEECAVMLIKCRDDEQVFIDDVGCGCEAGGP